MESIKLIYFIIADVLKIFLEAELSQDFELDINNQFPNALLA